MRNVPAPLDPHVGDMLGWTLVTDTLAYEVTKVTARTITVRRATSTNRTIRTENRDGNPYPISWTAVEADSLAPTQVLRRRLDGTFRFGDNSHPLRPLATIDGIPVERTDYRM
jgi:hypothetical protein